MQNPYAKLTTRHLVRFLAKQVLDKFVWDWDSRFRTYQAITDSSERLKLWGASLLQGIAPTIPESFSIFAQFFPWLWVLPRYLNQRRRDHRKYVFLSDQTGSCLRAFLNPHPIWLRTSTFWQYVQSRRTCKSAFLSCGFGRDFPFCLSALSSDS